jgi:acetyltransferase-like isoleucine patch superfamily enzyme
VRSVPPALAGDRLRRLGRAQRLSTQRETLCKLLAMIVRGSFVRPRLASADGMLLLGRGVRMRNPSFLSFKGRLLVEDFAEIQGLSESGLTFGRDVSVGAFAMIRPSGYYSRRIGEGLRVGDRSSIGPYCYIGCSGFVSIGSDVMLAPGVQLFAENHVFGGLTPIKEQGVEFRPIAIEDDCWLASGVTVVGGVTIGAGSVIAAGSVVTRDVAPGSIMAGVPARPIRSRDAPLG